MKHTIVLQAGGESVRMGQNKALMPFLGRPLIERILERITPGADEIILTANEPEPFAFLHLPVYRDVIAGKGALGGLYTALMFAKNPAVAVLACDMPFASLALIEAEFALLEAQEADVVLPISPEGPEPLHAVYRRETCLVHILNALEQDRLKLIAWHNEVKVQRVEVEQVRQFDPDLRAFLNVNTPEEFAAAEVLAREAG